MFSTISQTFRHHTVNRHFPLTTHTEKGRMSLLFHYASGVNVITPNGVFCQHFSLANDDIVYEKVFIRLDFLKTNSIYNGHCHRRSGNLFSFLKHNLKMMEKSCFCLNINKKKKKKKKTWKTIGELSMLQNRFIIFFIINNN